MEYQFVEDFDGHVPFMDAFHRRYMAANKALRAWAQMVRGLDIEIIAPQHGAIFRGKEMASRFISWCEQLECGVDLITDLFKVPEHPNGVMQP
jgi:flavorubredoxin